MVHLETSYLTHSKFSMKIRVIPDILPLFCARFRIFWRTCNSNSLPPEIQSNWKIWYSFPLPHEVWNSSWINTLTFFRTWVPDDLETSFSLVRALWSVIAFLFRARFGIYDELMLCPLFRMRFRVFDDPITSLLFRTRFEVIFLSFSARGLEWFRSSSAWDSKISFV